MHVPGDKPKLEVSSVVYATDFSASSENAGVYAKLLAQHFGATLFAAHAFIRSQAAMEIEADHKVESQQRRDLQQLIARKTSALSSDSLQVVPALLDGDPHHAVAEFAEKHAPALIVLGTHGAGRMVRGLIGSVAEKILRGTRWPCLTVGPHAPMASLTAAAPPFKRILCVTDFTADSAPGILFAHSVAEAFGAEIDILNVVPEKTAENPDRLAEFKANFHNAIESLVPGSTRDLSHSQTFVEAGNVHNRILEHVKERSIDVIMLGIRTTPQVGLEMQTPLAFQIIVDAPCPVLTVTRLQ